MTATSIRLNGNADKVVRTKPVGSRLYSTADPPSLETLKRTCSRTAQEEEYPLASSIQHNIPIYNADRLNVNDSSFQDEIYHVLLNGPGVFVLKQMYSDAYVIEKANAAFSSIIKREKSRGKGDHFSDGSNDRIWNSFSKHCQEDPASFVEYYSNPWLARVCEAWLGPAYRVTAQTNIVKPGGAAQVCHRDYHLGFQSETSCARFPKSIQVASQLLTLQGAIAHTDMPLNSGPTRFLPFSQTFEEGFMAYRLPEFVEFFADNYVSLALERGDGVFFNPALFHAAGANVTEDLERSANLLQVSSAFGKTMESIDSVSMVYHCWHDLVQLFRANGWNERTEALMAALAEGYPFPTNLDRRPPASGGMAPESEQDVIRKALTSGWTAEETRDCLRQMLKDSAP